MEAACAFNVVHKVEIVNHDFLAERVFEAIVVPAVQQFLAVHIRNLRLVRAALPAVDAEHYCTSRNLSRDNHTLGCFLVASDRLLENLPKAVLLEIVKAGSTEPGSTEVGSTEVGSTEPGSSEVGYTEVGSTEVGSTEPGSTEVGYTEVGSTEVDSTEVGSTEPGSTEVDSTEVGSTEVGSTEVDSTEVDSTEVDSTEVGFSEDGSHIFPTFAVLFEPVLVILDDGVKFFLCHTHSPLGICTLLWKEYSMKCIIDDLQ